MNYDFLYDSNDLHQALQCLSVSIGSVKTPENPNIVENFMDINLRQQQSLQNAIIQTVQEYIGVDLKVQESQEKCDKISRLFQKNQSQIDPFVKEYDRCQRIIDSVAIRQLQVQQFQENYQLTNNELNTIQEGAIDDQFFIAMERVQEIHLKSQKLFKGSYQKAGLEIMESMSAYENQGYDKITKFLDGKYLELSSVDPDVDLNIIGRAMKSMVKRPILYRYCSDEICNARQKAQYQKFVQVLQQWKYVSQGQSDGAGLSSRMSSRISQHSQRQQSGSQKGELGASKLSRSSINEQQNMQGQTQRLKRYIGDMLAWIHQNVAQELDLLLILFGYKDQEGNIVFTDQDKTGYLKIKTSASKLSSPEASQQIQETNFNDDLQLPSIFEILDKIIEEVCSPISQRINQVISLMNNLQELFRIYFLLQFYSETLQGMVNKDAKVLYSQYQKNIQQNQVQQQQQEKLQQQDQQHQILVLQQQQHKQHQYQSQHQQHLQQQQQQQQLQEQLQQDRQLQQNSYQQIYQQDSQQQEDLKITEVLKDCQYNTKQKCIELIQNQSVRILRKQILAPKNLSVPPQIQETMEEVQQLIDAYKQAQSQLGKSLSLPCDILPQNDQNHDQSALMSLDSIIYQQLKSLEQVIKVCHVDLSLVDEYITQAGHRQEDTKMLQQYSTRVVLSVFYLNTFDHLVTQLANSAIEQSAPESLGLLQSQVDTYQQEFSMCLSLRVLIRSGFCQYFNLGIGQPIQMLGEGFDWAIFKEHLGQLQGILSDIAPNKEVEYQEMGFILKNNIAQVVRAQYIHEVSSNLQQIKSFIISNESIVDEDGNQQIKELQQIIDMLKKT